MMTRCIAIAVVTLLTCDITVATEQVQDVLVFGARRYAIHEVPMLGLWDYGGGSAGTGKTRPPAFEVRSSGNWSGYRATFEIRDSKLLLRRIVGRIDGKRRRDEEIIPGKQFPIVASWYTGKIHIRVGEFDEKTHEETAVIVFEIEMGEVKSIGFIERMKPVGTWDGLTPDARTGDRDSPSRDQIDRE
jgi:hypothetical protein